MKTTRNFINLLTLLLAVAVVPAIAQQPAIANAKMQTRSAAAGLAKTVQSVARQSGPAWIGYAVPILKGNRQVCCSCSNNRQGPCQLESKSGNFFSTDNSDSPMLEGPRNLWVLLRVESNRVQKVRHFTEDCQLDAGGLPVVWLTDVRPDESVQYLASFVTGGDDAGREQKRKPDRALSAIALHHAAAADRALERFVSAGQPRKVRKKAAFWLGVSRGKRGFDILRRVVRNDKDDRFRKDAVFAIHISKEPEAVDELIALARKDRSKAVRKKALFWLGQRAGKKAIAALTDAIENDPDTDIKKRAVFALSQLPKGEGVPLLMKVARTNRNPKVRKQAIFWLGQSGDPRALAFFEKILTSN